MKKMVNSTTIAGLIYESKLEQKVTGATAKNPNTTYITGTLDIATDDACTNIVSVHYTYVTPVTSKGKTNTSYNILANIINGTYKTIMRDGKDVATKVSIDSAIGLNEFYSDRSGKEELVSVKRNEGGFINVVDNLPKEDARDTFVCDMVINGFTRMEADPDRDLPEKGIIKGVIFDYRNAILPVEFSILHPGALNYFEDQNISPKNVFCTQVWGHQISQNVVRKVTSESAFGESYVKETTTTRKDYVVTGARSMPYEFDSDEFITASELSKLSSDREVYKSTLKERQDSYKASKNSASISTSSNNGGFNF